MAQATKQTKDPVYFNPTFVEHEVNGVPRKFYALSVRTLFKLKNVAKPLLKALTTLFQGVGQENGVTRIRRDNRLADGTSGSEEVEELKGIDFKLAEVKLIEREKALTLLVEAFLDEKNGEIVAAAILDSLRLTDDEVAQPSDAEVKSFMGRCDVATLSQFIHGLVAANVGVLGPLGARLRGALASPSGESPPAESVPEPSA